MAITINHNAMAATASRNLNKTYGRLSTSVERMSSGLRINSAADDAAGLAIREMMRTDVAVLNQGIRNAADAISMIQTADGALGVIDEKLTRMKELAEQAATGTYTTVQRDIINSEYQAMAAEIDRIANATNFNGIKLLDGSVSNQHGGQGLKVHFGLGNNSAEDYYFINMGDARATTSTGLRVGGDAKNDIWGQGAASSGTNAGPGCCTGGFDSLNGPASGIASGQTFSFGYNWDWKADDETELTSGKYLAGRYVAGSGESLQNLVDKVNAGTQSRVAVQIDAGLAGQIKAGSASGAALAVCVGDEAYVFGDMETAKGYTVKQATGTYVPTLGMGVSAGMWADATNNSNLAAAGIKLGSMPSFTSTAQAKTAASAQAAALSASALAEAVSAYGASLTGYTELTLSASATTGFTSSASDILTSIILNNSAGTMVGSSIAAGKEATFSTGLYGDANGNYTDSAALAASLGFKEIMATVTTDALSASATSISFSLNGGPTIYTSALSTVVSSTVADIATLVDGEIDKAIAAMQAAKGTTGIAGEVSGSAGGPTLAAPDATNVKMDIKDVKIGGIVDANKQLTQVANAASNNNKFTATALASAINNNSASSFWAMTDQGDNSIAYIFHKEGGDHNDVRSCEVAGRDKASKAALDSVSFQNVGAGTVHQSGTTMSLGGEKWGTMTPTQTGQSNGMEKWNVTLNGRDVGAGRDLWITNPGDLTLPGMTDSVINGMDRNSFMEIQNAANAGWKGAEVRTQSSAQESLDALTAAITQKDKVRADLGALQNRLENTMTNLEIQAENLQASESRISDVDVAKEMTEFTRNNVLTQAGVSMLAQANSMSQLALSLL